ncbi:hypothetical protein REPUB_Repub02eG0165300 [Reevesia pubescens]
MTSNQEHRVTMPEIEQSDFITQEREKLKLAFLEAKSQGEGTGSSQRAKTLIQRIPPVLTGIKVDFKKYFEPRLVSLGPLHHGNPKFERAEKPKRLLAALFAKENNTTDLDLFNKIKDEITNLRKCYKPEEIKDYDDDKLAWIFFVDGCAVLYAVHYGIRGEFKKMKTKADLLVFATLDMFLLENQIPYRVLEILINSATKSQEWEQSLTDYIGLNVITNIRSEQKSQPTEAEEERKDYAHLLEWLRSKHLRGVVEGSSSSKIGGMLLSCGDSRRHRKTFRSFKELRESGIHVTPSKSNNLKNISFYCNFLGSLKMPRLLVDDSTAAKFMNLVALETCRDFDNDFAITSYLCFLGSLIDTAEDVKELRVSGMLHNYLGNDEEVADLFNRMSRDLVPDQEMYNCVTENIHKYCNNPWTATLAHVYYTHFSSSWTMVGFLGGIIYLIFSAIQAYFSLFPRNRSSD